ncbi:glycosyltransferase family 4 protein [bacterium]|nr:glycosyltransferase family 4 protein [bacterium]MBU1072168.1 glycosyltransferase family 4 protein [bacterium]MBU1675878.1 glycosyltransferase family 4 protein [bacterium]
MPLRVVMAESSDIYHDYRVQKEAVSLAGCGYDVTVRGFRGAWQAPAGQTFPFRLYTLPVFSRRYRFLRNLAGLVNVAIINLILLFTRADFYHAHNTMFLVGMYLSSRLHGGRFVYDAHEVQWEASRLAAWLEARFIHEAEGLINASQGRARAVGERFGIPLERFTIVSNYPRLEGEQPAPTAAREEGPLRMIFSGGYNLNGNRLDLLLEALRRVPGVDLYLLAFGYQDSEEVLKRKVDELGLQDRVRFVPLVNPSEVIPTISRYDVAVNLLTNPFDELNVRYCSTNKMYEYLAAGLPILSSDLDAFVEEFVEPGAAVAVDADDVESIVKGLHALTDNPDDLPVMKDKARELSRTRYNWGTQEEKLLEMYRDLARNG